MAYKRIDWVGKEDSSFVEGSSPAISAENLNNLQDGIEERILRSGDTMTGALKLYGEPTSDNEAATKKYVDENIIYISGEYNFTRGSTVVIGKIPNYNPMRHKVFVSTIESTFTEGHFPPSFIELTENGVRLDKMSESQSRYITAYIDENGYISVKTGSNASQKESLSFLVIPVKTATLIN